MASHLSVIVPVYNAEDYLSTCIDSILSQSFTDIELILVDDGSRDSSGAICDEYALKDSRIRVIHSPNNGVAEARNIGMNNVSAPYITFIDSDDYVPREYLKTLMDEQDGADFLVAEHTKCKREELNSQLTFQIQNRINIKCVNDFSDSFKLIDNGFLGQPYAKIFRKSIIEEHGIRFRRIQSEDELFVFDYLQYVSTIKKIDYRGYCYIQNDNSLSQRHRTLTEMNWIHLMVEFYYALDNKYHIFNDEEYENVFKSRMLERYYWFLLKGYYRDTRVSKKERIVRWRSVNTDELFKKTSIKVIVSRVRNKFAMIICLVAKLRLWFFADLLLKLHMDKKG